MMVRCENLRYRGSINDPPMSGRVHPFEIPDEYLDGIITGDIVDVSLTAEGVYLQEDAVELGYHQVLDFELFAPFNMTPSEDWVGKRLQIQWDDEGDTLIMAKLISPPIIEVRFYVGSDLL